jgi:hypothetical protein
MSELVFLLEEASAKAMLEQLVPRLVGTKISARYITFEGKQDLDKQLARRIRGYLNPEARFIVLRDLDSNTDCKKLKSSLLTKVSSTGKLPRTLVRIACQELEAFYLGDLQAVETALNIKNLAGQQAKRRFRDPDAIVNPKQELKSLTNNEYTQISGSRLLGQHLDLDNTRSRSFAHLIDAIRKSASSNPRKANSG